MTEPKPELEVPVGIDPSESFGVDINSDNIVITSAVEKEEVVKPAPKKRNKLVEKLTAKGPQIDYKCPACGTVFKAAVSVKWKVYTCPGCKEKYNLRPSAPQPHGGRE